MKLNIATDCSGIEAPVQALRYMNIPHQHIFSSEIDKYAIQSIKSNYSPKQIFSDITKRDHNKLPNTPIDIYVCGFPCQAFSQAGHRRGFDDKRGIVFFSCLSTIKTLKPKIFILENVKGLLSHDKGKTFKQIKKELENLTNYSVYNQVLNTRNYGIPQNRERVFFVGIRHDVHHNPFSFPQKLPMKLLKNFINHTDKYVHPIPECVIRSDMLNIVPPDAIFVEFGFKKHKHPNAHIYTPCINANNRMWCIPMHRYANIKELLLLQGFPENFKQVVSNTQLKKQIGNSMSVNVLVELFKECFKCIKQIA
jgi:DNA (cytosine-5)-methyltransferase 1